MEFEMKSVELKMEMEELKTKLMTQKKELALALNLEPSAQIELNGKLEHAHDFESGLKHSPKDHEHLIKPSELEADSLDQMATKESRAWFPKLDAYASYNQFNQLENDSIDAKDRTESILGLRLSMSLPGGFESSTESSAKAREAQARRIMAEQRKKEISAHVENEIEELRMKHAQVHDAEENITRAEKYYKLTMSEYSRGAKNSPDALGASEKLLSVRQKKIEIVRDFQVLTAHLLSKIGK
jgi:outer membrane protein TolC